MQASGQNHFGSQTYRLKILSCAFSIDSPIRNLPEVKYITRRQMSQVCLYFVVVMNSRKRGLKLLLESVETKTVMFKNQ